MRKAAPAWTLPGRAGCGEALAGCAARWRGSGLRALAAAVFLYHIRAGPTYSRAASDQNTRRRSRCEPGWQLQPSPPSPGAVSPAAPTGQGQAGRGQVGRGGARAGRGQGRWGGARRGGAGGRPGPGGAGPGQVGRGQGRWGQGQGRAGVRGLRLQGAPHGASESCLGSRVHTTPGPKASPGTTAAFLSCQRRCGCPSPVRASGTGL